MLNYLKIYLPQQLLRSFPLLVGALETSVRGELFSEFDGSCYLDTYLYLYSAEQEPPKKEKKNICPRSRYMPAITLIHLHIE